MDNLKSISRDLNVPVSTVHNIIKRFTAHGTVANLPGRGRKSKINEKLQRRIVQMVDKEPRLTSKQIQADLQTQNQNQNELYWPGMFTHTRSLL